MQELKPYGAKEFLMSLDGRLSLFFSLAGLMHETLGRLLPQPSYS